MLLKRVSIKNKNGINALFRTKKPIVSSTFRWDFEKGLRNVGYNLADKKLTNFPTKTVTALYTQKAQKKMITKNDIIWMNYNDTKFAYKMFVDEVENSSFLSRNFEVIFKSSPF